MNIYQIEKEYVKLVSQLIENDGELTPELEQALEVNKDNLLTKGTNYAFVIKQIDHECDIIDAEIKRLQSIKKARENAAERLKTRIKEAMQLFDMPELKTPLVKLSFRKSTSVEVDDVNALPEMYKTIKLTESADKKLIKQALETGKEIPGCRIVENNNLQIK